MNEVVSKNLLSASLAFIHGACLVLLDGLGVNSSVTNEQSARKLKISCLEKLIGMISSNLWTNLTLSSELLPQEKVKSQAREAFLDLDGQGYKLSPPTNTLFGISPFFIPVGPNGVQQIQFSMEAPTTSLNVLRVLRAMQLPRAVLLEVRGVQEELQ